MGRWAQAERRGRQANAPHWGTFSVQSLAFEGTIEANWGANTSPDYWELELRRLNGSWSVLHYNQAAGSDRSYFVASSYTSGKFYKVRIRPWQRGLPGPWSNELIAQAP